MDLPKTDGRGFERLDWESVDIIVKSDNEPALTSLIASWSTMRAMTEWIKDDHREQSSWQFKEQWDCREGGPVGAGDDQGRFAATIEGRWRVKIDATHSIWPWIAEHAGFLLTRFEVGTRWEDRVQETEGQISKSTRHGIC